VSHVRFSPSEYDIIAGLCRALGLCRRPFPAFRRLLLASLADCFPEVAVRVAVLDRPQVALLYHHLRQSPLAERRHGLTPAEVGLVAEAGVPLLSLARFFHPLRRVLVRRLQEGHPELAAKLKRLSLAQFAGLCHAINGRGGP
jgi:hypothetical protein